MTPTQGQIIRVHGVLPLAMDNCLRFKLLWPTIDQSRYLFCQEKKRSIKIKTEIGKRNLVRSYQGIFQPTAFDRSEYFKILKVIIFYTNVLAGLLPFLPLKPFVCLAVDVIYCHSGRLRMYEATVKPIRWKTKETSLTIS